MQFTAAFVLAAAVVGVSANVHSTCECVSDGEMNKTLTATACKSYDTTKFYDSDEDPIANSSSVIININNSTGVCQTLDASTQEVTAHIGGDEFAAACTIAAPVGIDVKSTCD